jgi:hypothetical protein
VGTPARGQGHPGEFFNALGEEWCQQIMHFSADAAEWVAEVVAARCLNAVHCAERPPQMPNRSSTRSTWWRGRVYPKNGVSHRGGWLRHLGG